MSSAVGVDWGSKGWVCVEYDASSWSASLQPSFLSVWQRYGGGDGLPTLVDIPIGLPDRGTRDCDLEARDFLGNGQHRVFLTPPGPVLHEPTYEAAKAETKRLTDHSLTTQAWSLLPCIQEVDDFLATVDVENGVREAHPEVCFGKLGAEIGVLASKHGDAGIHDRKQILDTHIPGAAGAYEDLVSTHITDHQSHSRRFRLSNRDDLLDAMALAVTAYLGRAGFDRFGGTIDPDRGLPMEIVYATDH